MHNMKKYHHHEHVKNNTLYQSVIVCIAKYNNVQIRKSKTPVTVHDVALNAQMSALCTYQEDMLQHQELSVMDLECCIVALTHNYNLKSGLCVS